MKKKIFAGLGLLIAVFAIAFAQPSYEDQVQAKIAGYDWGYYSAKYDPTSDGAPGYGKSKCRMAAEDRGYTSKNGLLPYFRDGAKTGYDHKKAGGEYNNPYNTTYYIYNY